MKRLQFRLVHLVWLVAISPILLRYPQGLAYSLLIAILVGPNILQVLLCRQVLAALEQELGIGRGLSRSLLACLVAVISGVLTLSWFLVVFDLLTVFERI